MASASENIKRQGTFLSLSDFLHQPRQYEVFELELVPQKIRWSNLWSDLEVAMKGGISAVAKVLEELRAFGWAFDPKFFFDMTKTYCKAQSLKSFVKKWKQCHRHLLVKDSAFDCHYLGCAVEVTATQHFAGLWTLQRGTCGILWMESEEEVEVGSGLHDFRSPQAPIWVIVSRHEWPTSHWLRETLAAGLCKWWHLENSFKPDPTCQGCFESSQEQPVRALVRRGEATMAGQRGRHNRCRLWLATPTQTRIWRVDARPHVLVQLAKVSSDYWFEVIGILGTDKYYL